MTGSLTKGGTYHVVWPTPLGNSAGRLVEARGIFKGRMPNGDLLLEARGTPGTNVIPAATVERCTSVDPIAAHYGPRPFEYGGPAPKPLPENHPFADVDLATHSLTGWPSTATCQLCGGELVLTVATFPDATYECRGNPATRPEHSAYSTPRCRGTVTYLRGSEKPIT